MLNNGQQSDNDPLPSDEEIEKLFSKGKFEKRFAYLIITAKNNN